MRGQVSLPGLGVAFLILTAATLVGLTAANGALAAADRDTLDRRAAVTLSERLTAGRAPLTARPNVLNGSRLGALNGTALRERYGLADDAGARVRLDGRTVAATGAVEAAEGGTVRRLVLVERPQRRTLTPAFAGPRTVTLPRRTGRIRLTLSPPANTTVRRVAVNGRVVLRDPGGLSGTHTVAVSPYETARLRVVSTGPLDRGSVRLAYTVERTRKALLVVTADG
jgi:hypothetical protein